MACFLHAGRMATGKHLIAGFRHPPLVTLVLAMPISFKGMVLQQYAGCRTHQALNPDNKLLPRIASIPHGGKER